MLPIDRSRLPIVVIGAGIVVLIIVSSLVYMAARKRNQDTDGPQITAQPSDGASPSPTDNVSEVPDPTPTPTPNPSATPSVIPTEGAGELPTSATSFLANFYAAYRDKDTQRLEAQFTADSSAEMRSLRSRLFTGLDTDGNPAGPTLFSTTSAGERALSHDVLGAAPQDKNWVVTIREQRQSPDGQSIPNVTTLITLVPASTGQGTWLIDGYVHAGSNGKYDGFLTY